MVADLNKFRRYGQPSVMSLLNQIANDGCILVFNGKHRNWRSKAADCGLVVRKLGPQTITRDDNNTVTDLYVTWPD